VVLPTVENTLKYAPFWSNTFPDKSIYWIGSKSTIDNLEIVVNAINSVVARHPEVNFYIISNEAADFTKKIKNAHLVTWSQESYLEELAHCTVGIMPLKNNEYNRGKCGFKLIQYLNMKKPVIGSPVGVNSEIIGENGIIAETEKQWLQALERLLYDETFYRECVKHIEEDFFEKYHFKSVSDSLIEILDL